MYSKIKKILINIGYSLLLLTAVMLMAVSVRGSVGSPNEFELNTPKWKEYGVFELSPERGRFSLTYSVIENKSVYFTLSLARFIIPDLGYKDGNYVSLFAPLLSFIVAPGYVVGEYFGGSQIGAYSVIAIFGLLNLLLIKIITKELGGKSIAGFIAGTLFLFATPAYAYSVSLYQHHISTFLMLFASWILVKCKGTWQLFMVWFLCALSIPVDYPNLFLMLPVGIFGLFRIFKTKFDKNKYQITFNYLSLLTFTGLIIPLLFFGWFNHRSYGSPFIALGSLNIKAVRDIDINGLPVEPKNVNPQNVSEFVNKDDKSQSGYFKSRNMLNGLYIHFVSPDRGIIYFAPVVLFGIVGIVILQKGRDKYLPMFLGIVFANIVLYSMWGDPWGGWAFGSRYLIPTYAIMAIFIGVALSEFRRKWLFLILFYPILIYSIAVNTLGALTTSANPPKVEALPLEALSGKRERYSYDRNWEFLKSGRSKSFVFQTWGKNYVNSVTYYYIVSGTIATLTTGLLIYLILKKE